MKKYLIAVIDFLRNPYNGIFALFKRIIEQLMPVFGLEIKPFYDKTDFPWLQEFEESYEVIRQELLEVYKNDIVKSIHKVNENVSTFSNDDKWKIFTLYVYGNRIDKNSNLCPNTEAAIKNIPGYFTAFFSILEPGKQIDKHRGVYRGNTLAHLGLVVPNPIEGYTFHVERESKNWEEGKAFAFEDSYTHYVTNTSKHYRAVLIVEFRREVPRILKPFDNFIQNKIKNSYITKNIIKKLEEIK
jgi:aspartyl/asparaginyl beta-hydroxylase (cupin superfamily)